MLQIIAIKTKDKVFISDDISGEITKERYGSGRTYLDGYVFDDKRANKSFNSAWLIIDSVPTSVKKIIEPQRINNRYELREQFKSLNLPLVVEKFSDELEEARGMYENKYDMSEETFEPVEFQINIIEELDSFEITKKEFDLKFDLLDNLNTHPILRKNKPCKLSAQETYRIIRNHVKENIDGSVADITSDYDFCFTVKKRVFFKQKAESHAVYGKGRNRNKILRYEKRYKDFEKYEIFECAPQPYNSYSVVTPFSGKNEDDLKKNIENYLKDLMEYINEPICECEHCGGKGFIKIERKV